MLEITADMRVYTLLKNFPQILEYLYELSPKYKKLKNPILKATVARLATLQQAAMIGGFSSSEFVNLLRIKVGQNEIDIVDDDLDVLSTRPEWTKVEPILVINATKMLDDGKNPLTYINKKVKKLKTGETILLQSDFVPAPLIEEMTNKGFSNAVLKASQDDWYDTYIGLT